MPTRLTLSEARDKMRGQALSSRTAKLASSKQAQAGVAGMSIMTLDFEVGADDVEFRGADDDDQVQVVGAVRSGSKLSLRNVVGWAVDGALDLKKLTLRRSARAVPRQGSARRVRDPHANYTEAQLRFLQQHAAHPPRQLQGGQLSKRSVELLGEEFKLEPEQIIGWASSQETKRKQAAERALARVGKPNYDDWATAKLQTELERRGIGWKRKRDPGKRRLLEEDDDRQKKPKKRPKSGGGSAAAAGRKPKKSKAQGRGKGKRRAGGQGKAGGGTKKARQR